MPDGVYYPVNPGLQRQLDKQFTYHAPFGDQVDRYANIRGLLRVLAARLCELVPDSVERSEALTSLQLAMFWANAGIARNESWPAEPPVTD